MKRYSSIQRLSRWDGKQVYKTVYYPEIISDDNDIFIISNETDYLDTLSFKYYKDPSLYWVIALANHIGKGRMSVEPGLQIRIPTNLSKILSDFAKINS